MKLDTVAREERRTRLAALPTAGVRAQRSGRPRARAGAGEETGRSKHLYKEATRILRTRKPIVAAVQGWTRRTTDFKEGVKAWRERRRPNFEGR